MPKPRPSVAKRQREQAKRDKKLLKAERKAQRQAEGGGAADSDIETFEPADDESSHQAQ